MTERWIVNASPIILLAKIERIDLLTKQADALAVPEAVAQEILNGKTPDLAPGFYQSN